MKIDSLENGLYWVKDWRGWGIVCVREGSYTHGDGWKSVLAAQWSAGPIPVSYPAEVLRDLSRGGVMNG